MSLKGMVVEYDISDPLLEHLWNDSLLLLVKDRVEIEFVTTRHLYLSAKLFPEAAITAKKY